MTSCCTLKLTIYLNQVMSTHFIFSGSGNHSKKLNCGLVCKWRTIPFWPKMVWFSEPIFPTDVGNPGQVGIYGISHNSVSLRWTRPAGEVKNYTVTWATGKETEKKSKTNKTKITVTNLAGGTYYTLTVSAQLVDGSTSELGLTHAFIGEGNTFQNKARSFMSCYSS